jgi:hypothetical protein
LIENYQQPLPADQNNSSVLLYFNSEYECGNIDSVYYKNPNAAVSDDDRIDTVHTPSELFPDIDARYGVPTQNLRPKIDEMGQTKNRLHPGIIYSSASTVSDEEYVMSVQSDYNTKGYQQWFSFLTRGFQVDKKYKFVIGPFRRS